ncbi:MAG: ubiquinone biosynthesis regulatory protein kinase UbiB [Gammaproteobacteria bacterium]|nr:MAG: ubiquinone biosynthesis regulatory protein kinase UbiB [Gammaproteobacteria bacterium]
MRYSLRQFLRIWHIGVILKRYRLDKLFNTAQLPAPARWLRFFIPKGRDLTDLARGERLRLALQDLGPVYVKFGQILSTRRDLLPTDIADELALLQDRVPPFPGEEARDIIEKALREPVDEVFAFFDTKPLASASIAQVHPATLHDGREAVVKVVRPGIGKQLRKDIELLKSIARLADKIADKFMPSGARVQPLEVVREFETIVFDELDMQREAANASILRRNFEGSHDLYIPEVYWQWCTQRVMVMERVSGLPIGDIEGLREHGVNLKKLARLGVRVFYTQVFRDNLFHADMHPGNILVDATDPDDPTFIAMDFGIVASLPPKDLYYISENFIALFNQDYRRVATLHIEAGWVPGNTRVDELEAAVRTVGEPNFTRPVNEVSFGKLLFDLFSVAHRFQLTIQPQLLMLQKTLLNIEGLGRQLDPELDIWSIAKPELEAILRKKNSPVKIVRELRERLPRLLAQAPEFRGLLHNILVRANNEQLSSGNAGKDSADLKLERAAAHQKTLQVLAGGSLSIPGAILTALETGPWFVWGYSVPGIVLLALGGWLILKSLR